MSKWSAKPSTWVEPEPGNEPAICIRVIELGTQKKEFKGKESWKRQCMIQWELPDQTDLEGRPLIISKFYTSSLSDKANLRLDLQNWRGRPFTPDELEGFEQKNVLGKPCMLNLIRGENGRIKVGSISPLSRNHPEIGEPVNDTYIYDIDEHDEDVWDRLSDGIKALISKSRERQQATASPPAEPVRHLKAVSDDDQMELLAYEGSQPAEFNDDVIPF